MKLTIISPIGVFVKDQEVVKVLFPGKEGGFMVLEHHVSLISELGAGDIEYYVDECSDPERLSIYSGFVEVSRGEIEAIVVTAQQGREVMQQVDEKNKSEIICDPE